MNDVSMVGIKPTFDASTLIIDDDDSSEVEILDAKGNPTGVKWEIRSSDSPTAVALIDQFVNKRLNRMQKRQGTGPRTTSQELRTETIDTLVACVKGWSAFAWTDTEGNKQDPLPFTHDNARDVLTRSVIIRDQIDAAVTDRSGFTKS